MKKYSDQILKYFVVFFIITFCALCIYMTTLTRSTEIGGVLGKAAEYATIFEAQFYDFRLRQLRDKEAQDNDIVLAYIDDLSLEKIGRWPWTRTVWEQVIDRLNVWGAKVISFDVFFSEPENACNAESPDIKLARAIKDFQSTPGRKVILPYSLAGPGDPQMKEIPAELYNYIVDSEIHGTGMSEDMDFEEDSDSIESTDSAPDRNLLIAQNDPQPANTDEIVFEDDETATDEQLDFEGEDELEFEDESEPSSEADNQTADTTSHSSNNISEARINRTSYPVPALLEIEPGLGFLNTFPNLDGVFRHFPVIANIETIYFPSLALMSYEAYTGDKSKVKVDQFGTATFNTKSGSFQLNKNGETKIRFFGDRSQFGGMSIWDMLNKPLDDPEAIKTFKDKLVYVATVAMGAHDLRNAPLDSQMPGVYLHMNLSHMLIAGDFFKSYDESIIWSFAFLTAASLLLVLVMLKGNAILDILALIGLLFGIHYADAKFFFPEGYELKLVFVSLCIFFIYLWSTFLNFYKASKEKAQIKGAFQHMIAPAIVDELLADPDKLKLGGVKQDITCMFSDVRDFTSISEKLTPEQLSSALNVYMTAMTNILLEEGGTLDKYIGDAIVGYWGAPVPMGNHAYKALIGARKMIEALPPVNEQFKEQGLPLFKHGIGLNSGVCSVGNMGSDRIFSYTALGDNMNLGARIESLCKFYGAQLMCSEYTIGQLSDEQKQEFVIRKIDMVRVKGKEEAVTIFEVFHDTHHLIDDKKALDDFHEAFDLYTKKEFDKAIALASPYLEKYPQDRGFQILCTNCENYLKEPPPENWDGVTTYTTK